MLIHTPTNTSNEASNQERSPGFRLGQDLAKLADEATENFRKGIITEWEYSNYLEYLKGKQKAEDIFHNIAKKIVTLQKADRETSEESEADENMKATDFKVTKTQRYNGKRQVK